MKVSWQAPPLTGETGDVDQYIVVYDTVTPPVRFQKGVGPVTTAFIDGLDPTQRYYFTVAAVNSFGTTPARTSGGAVETLPAAGPGLAVNNRTTPSAPPDLLASGGTLPGSPAAELNKVVVRWNNPVMSASGSATCLNISGASSTETAPVLAGEVQKYEILRSEDPDFDPGDPTEYTLVTTGTPNLLTISSSSTTFEDKTAVACIRYYYTRVTPVCRPVRRLLPLRNGGARYSEDDQ